MMARKKLGEILIEKGLIDNDQLNSALAYQRQWGHRLGVAMVFIAPWESITSANSRRIISSISFIA